MIQRSQQPRLALEAREPLAVGRERVGQDLDRDVAPEPRVARAIDLAHAAGTQERDDLVHTQSLTDELHRSPAILRVNAGRLVAGPRDVVHV